MKIKLLYIILLLFLTITNCIAQENYINTDRPDQSDGTYTVPKGKFQVEDGPTLADQIFVNNFMLRFGLTKSTELRLLVNAGKEYHNSGLEPLSFSLKQRILNKKDVFSMTFVGYVTFPTLASKDFAYKDSPKIDLKLAFENDLSDKFSLSYNLGTNSIFSLLNATLNLGYSPIKPLSFFVEYFGTYETSKLYDKFYSEHNIDAGILFAVTPHFQLDAAAGSGIKDFGNNRFYVTFGFSILFDKN